MVTLIPSKSRNGAASPLYAEWAFATKASSRFGWVVACGRETTRDTWDAAGHVIREAHALHVNVCTRSCV